MSILVTGANGFVGNALCQTLETQGYDVKRAVREVRGLGSDRIVSVGDIEFDTDWSCVLDNISIIIHTAARVHIMNDNEPDSLLAFRKVNTAGTLNLATQAAKAGVKRFVFISSIKVNGEMTKSGKPFSPDDRYIPTDPYGLSKYEAEKGLLALAQKEGMNVVIIRPPLVYGPEVRGNFLSMMKWIEKGMPLPLGAINNQRSLVALDNLVNFIICCLDHPKAVNEVFLISDGEDVSTTELVHRIARAFGKKTRLIPVPTRLMVLAARLIGKGGMVSRLFGSLQVDSSKASNLLGWNPIITIDAQLIKTTTAFLNEKIR